MALFKVLRGDRVNLDKYDFHDGYAYFCSDTGEFFIDCITSQGEEKRKRIGGGALVVQWEVGDENLNTEEGES